MSEPSGNYDDRLAALERVVGELIGRVERSERDSAAARVLAGAEDRDVDEIRKEVRDFRAATTRSFNAMRDDIADLRTTVVNLETKVDNGFAEMRGKFDQLSDGIAGITGLLTTLINGEAGDQSEPPADQGWIETEGGQ